MGLLMVIFSPGIYLLICLIGWPFDGLADGLSSWLIFWSKALGLNRCEMRVSVRHTDTYS